MNWQVLLYFGTPRLVSILFATDVDFLVFVSLLGAEANSAVLASSG